MVCSENDNETQAEIKQKIKLRAILHVFVSQSRRHWIYYEKFFTSRVRLDKQMPFACNKLNFDHCFDMCQSLALKHILNHTPYDIFKRNLHICSASHKQIKMIKLYSKQYSKQNMYDIPTVHLNQYIRQ